MRSPLFESSEVEEVELSEVEEEEEEAWPPVWKAVEKSPEYYFIGGFLAFNVHVDGFPPGTPGYEVLQRFIRQLRESRGYDVDCMPPMLSPSLYPRSLEFVMGNKDMSEMVEKGIAFVIEKINAQAERHGEKYVYDKLEKVVNAAQGRTFLLTFTVKEVVPSPNVVKTVQAMVFRAGKGEFRLENWRFKPHPITSTCTASSTDPDSD